MHGAVYYEGAAQPQNMQNAHPFYYAPGAHGLQVDHTANLMNNFNNAHEERKRRRRNGQHAAPNPPPPIPPQPTNPPANPPNAPLPQPPPVQPDYDQFNAQFHHHFQNQAQQMEAQRIHQVREEMMQREAQEAHRQQQLQQQLLQQQAHQARQQQLQQELLQRQAEEAHRQQQLQQALLQRRMEEAHHQQQLEEAHYQQQLQQQLLQRQAEEAYHQQQLQQQLLQRQEAEDAHQQWEHDEQLHHWQAQEVQQQQELDEQLYHQQAQEVQRQQELDEQLHYQQAQQAQWQQELDEQLHHQQAQQVQWQQRQERDEQRNMERREAEQARLHDIAREVAERAHNREQRRLQAEANLQDAFQDFHPLAASQQQHDEDEERQQERRHHQRQAENDHPHPNLPITDGGRQYTEPVNLHYLGPFTVQCPKCHALHFLSEKLSDSSQRNPRFGTCCLQGQVSLPPQQKWPIELDQLYAIPQFVNNIRQYNCATSFTSVGVAVDNRALQNSGPHAFEIHGALHHNMGGLMPPEGQQAAYAQLYIYDAQEATDVRAIRNPNLNPAFLRTIHDVLWRHHPFAQLNKQAYQVMREKPPEEQSHVFVRIHFQEGTDGRRYNLPSANEIAAVIPGDGSEDVSDNRDIILRLQGGQLRRISHLSPFYSTLHYVLLFPRGEEGWHLDIPLQVDEDGRARSKKVTQLLYYAYRLHIRPPEIEPPNIFRANRLFQQYGVDAWASIEQSNLNWIRNNQKRLRADCYRGLTDNVINEGIDDLSETGRAIILPSSHSGSSRYMYQLLQDSLAICRVCQKPDLFLTMTANGKWREIVDNLLPGEIPFVLSLAIYLT